ncbi:hypothetical protein CK203_031908 [Vitis vinifera]|uniref:Retrotransposon Copia-like N-terminal domain-containing protein n=1 Tax=Vitis vinifera TaxID=29760 RepID=A0A438IN74_VITVI|nr:hypothetical protein CK203_031908 [Vitis vinifera]
MTSKRPASSSNVIFDSSLVNFGGNGGFEKSVHHITVHKLNGKNYLQWSQLVMMYICGRGKDDYITDRHSRTFLFYKTTKEIWDAAKETFSDSENAAEVFEIQKPASRITTTRPQRDPILQHFLPNIGKKLDVFEEMEWDCVRDSIKYHKIMEKERIFTFLVGLNSIRISMKSEEGILALSHSHHFERHVLKSDKKRVERRS